MDNEQKLSMIAALLNDIIDNMDIKQSTCVECGLNHYKDIAQKNAYDKLSSALTRVEKVKTSLKAKP